MPLDAGTDRAAPSHAGHSRNTFMPLLQAVEPVDSGWGTAPLLVAAHSPPGQLPQNGADSTADIARPCRACLHALEVLSKHLGAVGQNPRLTNCNGSTVHRVSRNGGQQPPTSATSSAPGVRRPTARGVYARNKRWQAKIRVDGKLHYLGSFSSEESASHAFSFACTKYGRDPTNPVPISSSFRGVSYDNAKQCWRAQIRSNGKKRRLGSFSKEIEAARAYDRAARAAGFGGRANFPLASLWRIQVNNLLVNERKLRT